MGGSLSKRMESIMKDTTKQNQEFMLTAQKMQVERQLQMQMIMRQRMMAQQLSMARERLHWWGTFYIVCVVGLTAGFLKTRQPFIVAPLVPLSWVVAYQADLAYGDKMDRVLTMADEMLQKEQHMLALPGEPLTVELVDRERSKAKK